MVTYLTNYNSISIFRILHGTSKSEYCSGISFLQFISNFNVSLFSDIVVFDNTFSWMKSKDLSYSIEVKPPSSQGQNEQNVHLSNDDYMTAL